MEARTYNVIVTEFEPGLPKIMRLLKTKNIDRAVEIADKMKARLGRTLEELGQTIVVVSFDHSDGQCRESLDYITR